MNLRGSPVRNELWYFCPISSEGLDGDDDQEVFRLDEVPPTNPVLGWKGPSLVALLLRPIVHVIRDLLKDTYLNNIIKMYNSSSNRPWIEITSTQLQEIRRLPKIFLWFHVYLQCFKSLGNFHFFKIIFSTLTIRFFFKTIITKVRTQQLIWSILPWSKGCNCWSCTFRRAQPVSCPPSGSSLTMS